MPGDKNVDVFHIIPHFVPILVFDNVAFQRTYRNLHSIGGFDPLKQHLVEKYMVFAVRCALHLCTLLPKLIIIYVCTVVRIIIIYTHNP